MFGKEKFETIYKRIDAIELEVKDIRNRLDKEIKTIERAGKPISNEITNTLKGDFYNNPLRDITQEINSYFDTVISKEKLCSLIESTLEKYELDVSMTWQYVSYLLKDDLIQGMMEAGEHGLYPFYMIQKSKMIPSKRKSDRGVFNELGL